MARKSGKSKNKKTIELKAKRSSRRDIAVPEDEGASGGGSSRSKKRSSRKQPAAAASDKKTSRRTRAVPSGGGGGGARTGGAVGVMCRECQLEFRLDAAKAKGQETITCPVCEHRAQAPSDDILHQIALWKGIEHKNVRVAVGSLVLGLFSMGFWTVFTSSEVRAADPAVFYGPIALAVICLLVTLVFGAKYERSRWETFF